VVAVPRGAGDMNLKRFFRHALLPPWVARRTFSPPVMRRVEDAVKSSERSHRGELRVAVEACLELEQLWRKLSPRARAEEVFSQLRVWDTAENSGVLLYINWADRNIEIVADRGISARVTQDEWEAICRVIERSFRTGQFETGLLQGIAQITNLLTTHFPAASDNVDELSNKPVVL
jgi:hypothetical protein